jgi:hypothetical protein
MEESTMATVDTKIIEPIYVGQLHFQLGQALEITDENEISFEDIKGRFGNSIVI